MGPNTLSPFATATLLVCNGELSLSTPWHKTSQVSSLGFNLWYDMANGATLNPLVNSVSGAWYELGRSRACVLTYPGDVTPPPTHTHDPSHHPGPSPSPSSPSPWAGRPSIPSSPSSTRVSGCGCVDAPAPLPSSGSEWTHIPTPQPPQPAAGTLWALTKLDRYGRGGRPGGVLRHPAHRASLFACHYHSSFGSFVYVCIRAVFVCRAILFRSKCPWSPWTLYVCCSVRVYLNGVVNRLVFQSTSTATIK